MIDDLIGFLLLTIWIVIVSTTVWVALEHAANRRNR